MRAPATVAVTANPRAAPPAATGAARLVALVVLVAVGGSVAAACRPPSDAPPAGRLAVVAAFYPLAEAVRQVGGGRVAVRDLTPVGGEPHDLELTPRDVDRIEDATLVVVLGGGFQPAVDAAARRRRGPTLVVLDALDARAGRGASEAHGSGRLRAGDPHVWLDPVLMQDVVRAVGERLARVDPGYAARYRSGSAAYVRRLAALDARFRSGLARCERRTIVTSHDAFGYLAHRYGLEQRSVVGLVPDQEPDPKTLGELADLVRREGITTVFTGRSVSSRVAETIAREAGGVRVEVLDPLEALTGEQVRAGADYVSVMLDNLRRLRRALDCRP
ncbi:MAG: zinc ABC transporter substrate-binding protein [Acidimicrobiia bacterium]|nr:zinc ABC transporter substrate-binding protein [Acidimicrobiia bacterium]